MNKRTQTTTNTIVIQPSRGWNPINFKELWEYRELLYFLVWRDIKVRYKQTVLGAAWAILQPFLTMIVFSIFFGQLAKLPSDGIPYPIFTYTALLPWQLFTYSVTQSAESLVANQQLITKVYFPRLVIPIAAIMSGTVDFILSFFVLLGLMFYYGIVPTIAIIALPFFIILTLATALGVGLWLSVLNVRYRDVRYTIPFLVQIWLFVTPVVYSSTLVPSNWRLLYGLNPMAGVVEGFRWALLGKTNFSLPIVIASSFIVIILLVGGLFNFRRMEKSFADIV